MLPYLFPFTTTAFADDNQQNLKLIIKPQQEQSVINSTDSLAILTANIEEINADGVRLRSDPNLSSTILELLYKGNVVEIGDTIYSSGGYTWYYVTSLKQAYLDLL